MQLINSLNKIAAKLDEVGKNILKNAKVVDLPIDTRIFGQGDICENYILVIEGSVKVFTRTQNGREILLYRVKNGESCTLTTSCLLADNKYPAESITETAVSALVISAKSFNQGLQQSEKFRQFVFNAYGERIRDVISLVEAVSFGKIDVRLARALLEAAGNLKTIKVTHQQLATDIGTAREVVSRHLKEFERKGWLKLFRGGIEVIDYSSIEDLGSKF